jgi:hypothetical protein
MIDIAGWIIALFLVVFTIGIHYEIMRVTSDALLPWALKRFHDRRVMMLIMGTLLFGHIIEIWIYACAMMVVAHWPELGQLAGTTDMLFNTYLYFSSVSYTSLGYGDITPTGIMQAIAVSEALSGLLMIAWSASFAYIKMEKIWDLRQRTTRQQ